MIDLSQLPPPEIVEPLDFETILAARKARLIALYPTEQQEAVSRTLELESEPLVKLLEENAYRELILRQRINDACLAVMLAYARRSDLDQLAAHWDVERLTVQAADPAAVPPVAAVMELDERLRYRTQLAMEGLTVAGSRGAYTFHALSASARVRDVSIVGPELVWIDGEPTSSNGVAPGIVKVYVLDTENNGTPDAGLLATVAEYLTAETRRPLCDTVEVEPAEVIEYEVQAVLWIYPGPSEAPVIAEARARTEQFAGLVNHGIRGVENHYRLGYDIVRSGLDACLHVGGVQRVEIIHPAADIIAGPGQAARCTGITITVGGRDV